MPVGRAAEVGLYAPPMRRVLCLFCTVFAAGPAFSSPVAEAAEASFEQGVVMRINQARKARGLRALRPVRPLRLAAVRHARFLARHGVLQHASADGSSFDRRIRRHLTALAVGETVARGPSPRWVVRAWLGSAHHRALLLEPSFRIVGVGVRAGGFGAARTMYVTADFARP